MKISELVADTTSEKAKKAKDALKIDKLKACIPAKAFEKNLLTSLWYMGFDYAMIGISMGGLYALKSTGTYDAMPVWAQFLVGFLHWQIAGFFMWCIFVVGHDCGHGSFSEYFYLNEVLGNILHASILVPYWPWRLSHKYHHMKHNHKEDDYSHPWITEDKVGRWDWPNAAFIQDRPLLRTILPLIGWPVYMSFLPDGSHFIPVYIGRASSRLWENAPRREVIQCCASSAVVAAMMYAVYQIGQGDMWEIVQFYYGPVLVFGWWLTMVTYLQHHDHDSVVYGNSNWKYNLAAFETIDRKYGYGIDHLHHHITDGHVAHHLFFTTIPHYNLPIATHAIRKYLENNKIQSVYKLKETYDFPLRFHKQMYEVGFGAKELLAPDGKLDEVVPERPWWGSSKTGTAGKSEEVSVNTRKLKMK